MELYPVGERFFQEFTLRQVLLNAAKNGSGPSVAGTSSRAEGPNTAEGITEEDLRTGRYDFAEVRMFLVNYENLAQGILRLWRGWLGEVVIRDGMYVAELRGMTQRLQMTVGQVYAPDCAADLGDARSGVDLVALEEGATVTAVTSATTFETSLVQATAWYDGGELTWTSGANTGQAVAVRSWDAATGTLTLFLPALYAIQAGDAFTIRPAATRPSRPARRISTTRSTSAVSLTSPATTRFSATPMRRVETAEIVAAARTWLGTPWRHQGRLKGVAVDCGGLILGVGREFGLLDFDVHAHGRIPDGQQLRVLCDRHLVSKPIAEAAPGDVLLMRFTRHPQHLAIVGAAAIRFR
jgi:uncharacterized phage protein (TIGR02218 family)